jgi:GTPase SAR1 family protein
MNHYDYLAKILIVGNSGVGKTNLLLKFCQN